MEPRSAHNHSGPGGPFRGGAGRDSSEGDKPGGGPKKIDLGAAGVTQRGAKTKKEAASKAREASTPAPEPSAQPGLAPVQQPLNAAVAPFVPQSTTGQAPLRGYADALKSAVPKIGSSQSTSSEPRSVPAAKNKEVANETGEAAQAASQVNAPGILPSGEPHPNPLRSSPEGTATVKGSDAAESKDASSSTSHTVSATQSAITDAFRSAPPARSFLDSLAQTRQILATHARPALELSSIGPDCAPTPTRDGFQATWAQNRVRSSAFPQPQEEPNSSQGSSLESAASSNRVISSVGDVSLSPGAVAFSAPPSSPFQSRIPAPSLTRVALSRPASFSNIIARRRLHMQSKSLSQSAVNPSAGRRPSNRRFSFTPTKTPLNSSQTVPPDSPLDRPGDTPEQKEKIRNLMSEFREVGDSFDSIEWQHGGQTNYSESPETLTVPPQPVASYTTVGSLRPATSQHFTAPNRIQRDGTGRRAPQAHLQGRGHDNQSGRRTMNQQYNPGHRSSIHPQRGGMNYSQYGPASQPQSGYSIQPQFGPINPPQHGNTYQLRYGPPVQSQVGTMSQQYGLPNQFEHGVPTTSRYEPAHQRQYGPLTPNGSVNAYNYGSLSQSGSGSTHNVRIRDNSPSIGSTEAGINVFQPNGLAVPLMGSSVPSMRSGNVPQQDRDMMLRNDPLLNPREESFNLQNQHGNSEPGRNKQIQDSISKTSTTDKVAQDTDSRHPLVRNTFSESSATNNHRDSSTGSRLTQQAVMTGSMPYGQAAISANGHENTGHGLDRGDFNHNYRFPPPVLTQHIQENQSGGNHSQQMASGFGSKNHVTEGERRQNRSGRPEPLTAGPPGQRLNASGFQDISSSPGVQVGVPPLSNVQQPPTLPPNSLWQSKGRSDTFRSVPAMHNMIHDTIPTAEAHQYYPNGFPNNMTGQYTRLPEASNENRSAMSHEEATNNWFRSGLRNLDMTANDHISEMDRRNLQLDNVPNPHPQRTLAGHCNPPTLQGLTQTSEPLTVEQIKEMEITEVSARLMHCVFGNTLKLADQRPSPNNLALLSRYAPGAPWTIDDSPQGNQSFFGEDWGPTPRRVGRDPRYQPFE